MIVPVSASAHDPNDGNHGITEQCADGTIEMALPVKPDTKVALMNPVDFGVWVREAIESPSFGAGSEVLAAAEELTVSEMARQWGEGEDC